jgi:hypothetical protein
MFKNYNHEYFYQVGEIVVGVASPSGESTLGFGDILKSDPAVKVSHRSRSVRFTESRSRLTNA